MLLSFLSFAQDSSKEFYSDYAHTTSDGEGKVKFYLRRQEQAREVKLDRKYFWYSGNQIHSTQGGYSGKLLHGSYTSYYVNKSLRESGSFDNGLKAGKWKNWATGGNLVSIIIFRSGLANGRFVMYDSLGNIYQSGRYKAGKLEGVLTTYRVDSVLKTKYHKGVVRKSASRGKKFLVDVKNKLRRKNRDKPLE